MEVRIGIVNITRELAFESSQTAPELEAEIAAALSSGAQHLALSDDKGRRFLVPTASIAYVELGAEAERRVGFVA
ncbi:MAG TPA: DUF3107 domain-containing protein [Microbacteriaceae bacterium]|nr:DUF3107 domain-containing protein [Microbacteriaceae bacterium]